MTVTVTTQAELDAAIAEGESDIIVRSPRGVWLEISDSATVTAHGSATVRASDSATVRVVAVDTLVPLGDKVKAPSCEVLHEVDAIGREVAT